MAVTTTNLGVITAYGDAVAAGYTGTKAEWQTLMASYATVGQQAVDAKNDAVAAKDTAVSKATEATTAASTATTKANEASASAQSIAQSAAQIQENTDDIDQLKSELSDKADMTDLLKAFPVDTASGAIASFSDGAELPLKSLTVDIEPIQDLHGQESPYPAGGGVNQWDEEVELGLIDTTTGANTASSSNLRSKNFIPVLPSTAYYFKATAGTAVNGAYYDADKGFISSLGNVANGTFTTPSNAHYMRFYLASAYGTTYNHDISINYPSTDTAYHPYSNICPISGWSEVNVNVSGKNLFDSNFSDYTKPYDYYIKPIKLEFGKRYIVKAELVGTAVTGTVFGVAKKGYRYTEFSSYNVVSLSGDVYSFEFTVDDTFTSPKLITYVSEQAKFDEVMSNYNITLKVKDDQNPYEPYSCTFLNIALGQTVYGGTLDVLSGVLTIDRAMVDLGTWGWNYLTSGSGLTPYFFANVGAIGIKYEGNFGTVTYNLICSEYRTTNRNISVFTDGAICTDGEVANQKVTQIQIKDARYTDVATFKAAVTGQTLVYELATPITVTLTPNELSTLLGANNIWSDAGEVTAEYRADPTLFIQRKIAEALS